MLMTILNSVQIIYRADRALQVFVYTRHFNFHLPEKKASVEE